MRYEKYSTRRMSEENCPEILDTLMPALSMHEGKGALKAFTVPKDVFNLDPE